MRLAWPILFFMPLKALSWVLLQLCQPWLVQSALLCCVTPLKALVGPSWMLLLPSWSCGERAHC